NYRKSAIGSDRMSRPSATLCREPRIALIKHLHFQYVNCGLWSAYMVREESMRRETKMRSEFDRVELPTGPIYSFVPARGGSRAGAVAEQLSRTLTEVSGLSV